ncbi:MAG: 4-hydroxy-3-methylbut-2-enyl diphosphate reductase [Calditrichaeota bacterium]|nr:MAG: 4-hydroxy-3-methylbut-2-enyl diphosphate reductase [Calditrichota bacterium]
METQPIQIFRRGLGLKKEVEDLLDQDYSSKLIDYFETHDYHLALGDWQLYLARKFGFCYGVDRAVDYAYQTRKKFPDRRIFLTGEIIHNPHVNRKMLEMGIGFLTGQYADGNSFDSVTREDVVLLPAFGVTTEELATLKAKGCVLVDTTCGSVLNVWKRVEQYAQSGFTAIIHGKYWHEETRATTSQATKYPGGHYLVVLNMEETEVVCEYITGHGSREAFMEQFKHAVSPGFDPDLHLQRVGLANQTTMLSSESLAIAEKIRQAIVARYGEEAVNEHFMTFDTICSATQDRQDAVLELVESQNLDLILIIGGYNSSNTNHLAEIASQYTRAYHIDDASCLVSPWEIHYKPINSNFETVAYDWVTAGPASIGLTAGASTPNKKIGEVVAKLARFQNVDLKKLIVS